MKVLHVEGGRNLYGGARQVLYLLEGLEQRGIDNVLVCPAGSELAREAAAHAEVHAIPMSGDLDFRLIGRLYRIIGRVRPDLAHLHSRIGADVMGGIAARLAGVPVVHSRRQDNPEMRWAVAVKYRLHDRVVAISEGIARVLASEGLPAAKLRVVRSAIDPAPFLQPGDRPGFRTEFGLPEDCTVIGVIAQLIERKGHRFLLEALPELTGRYPGLHVLLFGKGPLESSLIETVRHLGLADRVHFAGFRDDLPRILPCLDLVVHPALREGLGISLLQAAAAGVPIVASRAGGIPEAVRDGDNGLLVPPGDAAALAAAIRRLLDDRDLARDMGQRGRALIGREFSVEGMVEGNLAVYRELLAEKGSPLS
ncbi:glycosyl transferase, group 1 family protein [Methylococcus capsulatus str. Bath]|uniref:Glycosyl transferase, group 1 family protein n=1 Tax=Methylococcus capsulatus (strain ATCC 33009 / NCIMB 11132 / Bath) TaxID=243233 RepID=Q605Z6_METCA|nr:glycosyltransferase [Methylococcus capsulatus]AAU91854.1 glycosyl transferase, group 1 family protein [Methylococcus capsulatus str. Bath]